ncbi:hypothetical protein AURDEDRAFT_160014 [Auricularia subglabra TFB-10046 SS5]|nr:hypothetical protein AURDEDRAFT_160014 [Auricularia subglabra TFB-10046 SS5]
MATASSASLVEAGLSVYGIEMDTVSAAEFFGQEPSVHLTGFSAFLNWDIRDDSSTLDARSYCLSDYVDMALHTAPENGLNGNLLLVLFPALGFTPKGVVASGRTLTPKTNTATSTTITADMCLRWGTEDETTIGVLDPELHLVAAAVAAFHWQDTQARRSKRGLAHLTYMEYPAIVMNGTRPSFYKVPVDAALDAAVRSGRPLGRKTRVEKYVVPSHLPGKGSESNEYRRRAMQYMESFKSLAFDLWEKQYGLQIVARQSLISVWTAHRFDSPTAA